MNDLMSDGKIISIVLVAHRMNVLPRDQQIPGSMPAIALFYKNRIQFFFLLLFLSKQFHIIKVHDSFRK